MASLNTLRTRGALFLSIIIGVALIAFLLGDLTSASSVFQSRRNRVGSVAGNNIDYMEFAAENDNMTRIVQAIYGQSSLSPEQSDQVREMVWESYIRRYSYEPGYRKMGLTVGEAEQLDMVRGQYVSPVVSMLFASRETGIYDPAALEEFIRNKGQDTSGQMDAVWRHLEDEMSSERSFSKYTALVAGGMFVNDLEVAHGVEVANTIYGGEWASVSFSSVADSLVKVSSAEVRKYFNAHKGSFKQTASRDIEYVVFDLSPSESDYADAETRVNELAAEFAVAAEPVQYASLNSQERVDAAYYSADKLSPEIAAMAFSGRRGAMVGPTLEGDVYTMARVGDVKMMPDSVGAKHILLDAMNAGVADSLVGAIRRGADIARLAAQYSIDPTVDLGVFAPETMVEPFAAAVSSARRGDVLKVQTQFGVHVVQMTYVAPLKRKAQIATIKYNVAPSPATEQAAYNEARDFLALAAGSKKKFDAAVDSTGVSRRVATVNAGDKEVRGLNESRELVRWSFNSKPSTVSTIFDIDGDYVVSVLVSAKEAGTASARDAAQGIADKLRTDKKAAILAEQMKGKSVAEIALMQGATEGTFADLKYTAFYVPDLGVEPAVIGAVSAVAEGELSKPVKGGVGVYVVSVGSKTLSDDTNEVDEKVRLEATAETGLQERVMQALRSGSDIKDNRSKFF